MTAAGPVQSPLALETGKRATGTQESMGNGQAMTGWSLVILHLLGEAEPRGWGPAWCYRLGSLWQVLALRAWGHSARAACPFSHCGAGERTWPWGGCGGTGVLCSPVTHQQEGCGREG